MIEVVVCPLYQNGCNNSDGHTAAVTEAIAPENGGGEYNHSHNDTPIWAGERLHLDRRFLYPLMTIDLPQQNNSVAASTAPFDRSAISSSSSWCRSEAMG
jgi:hypothetical protein